jgi:multiple sugar transport system permease protein
VYLLVLPAVGYRLFWTAWPLVQTAWLSLTDSNFIYGTETYIGLRNYRDLFADDLFWNSLYVSIAYAVVLVVGTVILGLAIAQLLAHRRPGQAIGRVAVLIPFTIPTVLAGQMWRSLATNTGSPLNDLLQRAGIIDRPIAWLSNDVSARVIVMLASLWRFTPFAAILFVAALAGMPKEIQEAAEIDGAGSWKRFRHVTLPMIAPAILVVMMFQTIEALRAFDIIYALTKGGPGTATDVLSYHAYQDMFFYGKSGYGSAQAVVLLVVTIVAVGLLAIWLQRRQRRLTR